MSSPWTHALCAQCWRVVQPERPPVTSTLGLLEICCRCGEPTQSGIYYRAAPGSMTFCAHQEDDDE